MSSCARNSLLIVVVAAVVATAPAFAAEGSFQRTLNVTGPVDLEIVTGSGSITVQPGNATTVQVKGYIKVNFTDFNGDEKVRRIQENPPIEQSGNVIHIGRLPEELQHNVSISYEVTAPQQTRLHSHTGSGRQKIEGIQGPLEANSGSGGIAVANIGSETQAHAGSGHLELENVRGSVRAETGSGSIRANGIAGAFTAHTGSGSVHFAQTAPGNVRVETGSGRVELENVKGTLRVSTGSGGIDATGEPTGRWDLQAGSGGVRLRVPQQLAFDVYAHTSSGSISVDHPVQVQGEMGKRELRGKVRGGGPAIEVRTGSGSIRIE